MKEILGTYTNTYGVKGWSETSSTPRLKFTPAEIEKYLALLEENVQRIQACTEGFDEARLGAPSKQGECSAADILGHLRACAKVWSNSIYVMLAQDKPSLPDIHPRRWAQVRGYKLLAFGDSFNAYKLGRQELLIVLRGLPESDWGKSAVIGERTHSVFSQVRRMAKHEAENSDQIEGLLACKGKGQDL